MSLMIPEYYSNSTVSSAEKRVFNWFRDDPRTDNWIVFHSVEVFHHVRYVYSEVDFIVLAPQYGFFFLEVKGGRVQVNNGIWTFTDKEGNSNSTDRGPFQQAIETFFSIRDYLKKNIPQKSEKLLDCNSGIGVFFPDINYTSVGAENDVELVFDATNDGDVFSYLVSLANYTELKLKQKNLHPFRPTIEDTKKIRDLLRPNVSFDMSLTLLDKRFSKDKIIEVTRQQSQALSLIEDNKQCLFYGYAGTGKTYLAIEAAKRLKLKGLSVAFFCYNKGLGLWLKDAFSSQGIQIAFVGTIHSYIVNLLKKKEEAISDWKTIVNDAYHYVNSHVVTKFDVIIVDEMQDLCTPTYLSFLSSILKCGLYEGRLICFGDFSTQNIYEITLSESEKLNLLKLSTRNIVFFHLTINCRNTIPIHNLVTFLYDIDKKSWMSADIQGPEYRFYVFPFVSINTVVQKLLNQGISPHDITILSPFSPEFSKSYKELSQKYEIKPFSPHEQGLVFSTIQAFKGLENDYIIICDMDESNFNDVFYVALTRARYALSIIGTGQLFQRMIENNG